MWFHHRLLLITQIGDDAFLAAWSLEDTNTMSMAKQGLVEVVNGACVFWKSSLEEAVSGIGRDFFAD